MFTNQIGLKQNQFLYQFCNFIFTAEQTISENDSFVASNTIAASKESERDSKEDGLLEDRVPNSRKETQGNKM